MTDSKVREYCRILELLALPLTPEELGQARNEIARKWHPDKHQHDERLRIAATEKMQSVNAAYDFLLSIVKRNASDPQNRVRNNAPYKTENGSHHQAKHQSPASNGSGSAFPGSVREVPLKSSWVVTAGYDNQTLTLYIKLKPGAIYRYMKVPPELFDELLSAESVGRFLNRKVFRRYEERR